MPGVLIWLLKFKFFGSRFEQVQCCGRGVHLSGEKAIHATDPNSTDAVVTSQSKHCSVKAFGCSNQVQYIRMCLQ